MRIRVKQRGNFNKTERFLRNAGNFDPLPILNRYGRDGVAALALATPEDSGQTARSWEYEIVKDSGSYRIEWFNTNIVDGVKIAVLLQYGHATRNGGWVEGQDYINPALKPIFEKIANDAWREVTKI